MSERTDRIVAALARTVTTLAQGRPPRQLVTWAAEALAIGWIATIVGWFVPIGAALPVGIIVFILVTIVFAAAVAVTVGLAGSALAASAIGAMRTLQQNVYAPPVPAWVPLLATALIAIAPVSFVVGKIVSIIVAVS